MKAIKILMETSCKGCLIFVHTMGRDAYVFARMAGMSIAITRYLETKVKMKGSRLCIGLEES